MSYSTKKIHNRYDYFEILACFSDSTDEFMLKKHQPIRKTFYIKCILGPLLALNAYLSHWGPWKWPDNQKLLIFSICFYYLVSYIFGRLDLVDKNEGALIGEYKTGEKQNRKYLMTVSDNKIDYILEQADSQTSKILRKKCFVYTDYFTQEGEFLEDLYHRHLGGFLKNKEA